MAISIEQIEIKDTENQQDAAVAGHPDFFQLKRKDSLTLNDLDPLDQSRSSTSSERDEDSENEEDPLPGSGEAPTSSLTVREALEGLFSSHATRIGGSHLVFVKRYTQGKTFRQRLAFLMYNHKIGSFLRILAFFSYVVSCLLYVAEAIVSDEYLRHNTNLTLCTRPGSNITPDVKSIFLLAYKPYPLWILQVVLAMFNLSGAIFALFVRQELYGSIRNSIRHIDISFAIIIVLGLLYMITLCYPYILHRLFVPSFLYCWPARSIAVYFITDHTRISYYKTSPILRNNTLRLVIFLACFVVTCICFFHHFERLGCNVSLFESYWFIVVTFSTVGFGDVVPSHWSGQLVVTIFIIIALIYLPPKVEELWSSFQLHRKLHSDYAKLPNSRHVLLIASSLKPLHLRDFLSEFYSDPDHSDFHCVVMVEQDLPAGIKLLLDHPRWHQRVNVLIGSGHKVNDLARAKARKADACFIRTIRHDHSRDVADQHTIMVAWTVKFYAPHCKLYVHVLRPESRFHLSSMADEVLCESELKQAVMANNSLCPGMSTIAALLMHTFKHEARGFKNAEYQLYEKCSPCEVYHVLLGESKYFHHFAGKNFLYTAVVAYRKFHVALLGVQRGETKKILFNPGVEFIMRADDTCFYIGESKEEHHTFEVVKPTKFQMGLWSATATLASLALHLAEFDPEDLHPNEVAENGMSEGLGNPSEKVKRLSRLVSLTSLNSGEGGPVTEEEVELDQQLLAERANWQHEAERGLKLLQFHSGHDTEARPCVKLNIVPKTGATCSIEHDDQPTCSIDEEDVAPQVVVIPQVRVFESVVKESSELLQPQDSPPKTHHHHHHHHHHERPTIMSLLRHSLSVDHHHHGDHHHHHSDHHHHHSDHHHHHHHGDHIHRGSSHTDLHSPKAGSVISGSGSSILSATNSEHSHRLDPMVVLQLNDVEEKEELEELEEGKVEPLSDQLPTPTITKAQAKSALYVTGPVYVPYCGSEPIECHLTPLPRQPHEIKINASVSSDGYSQQWRQKAVLVYCDQPTTDLFHFVLPLRISYHPVCSLKPVILLLEKQPDAEFVHLIAKLPMVYYFVGSISRTCDLLRAGILQSSHLMVLAEVHSVECQYEHLADARIITAVHSIASLFPYLKITTEINYRFNIRFLYTTLYDQLSLQKMRHLARKGDHLTYLFLPQFVAGKTFTSSMLDTLLYQAYQKPYIVQLFRQLLGCSQVEGSGFIWKYPLNEELLKLKNCGRLFQRLASTHACVPIGIYRSVHFTKPKDQEIKGYKCHDNEALRGFLEEQLELLELKEDLPEFSENQYQQFVFVNPPPDMELHDDDIILVIHPPLKHTNECIRTCPPDCDSASPPSQSTTTASPLQAGLSPPPTSPSSHSPVSPPFSPVLISTSPSKSFPPSSS